MGFFLFFVIACLGEYSIYSVPDDNKQGMFAPDCINSVSFKGDLDKSYWEREVRPSDLLDQFVGNDSIHAIHTLDHELHGFTYAGSSGEGIVIRYHNIPRESASLGVTFAYSGDSYIMESFWTTYDGSYQSLATVYLLFPIDDGLVYYNMRQLNGDYRWFEPGLITWKVDHYYYGLNTGFGEDLRDCVASYDAYLHGPTGPTFGDLP